MNVTHQTFPIQKLHDSVPLGYIWELPVSKLTAPGYHPIGDIPEIQLHPLSKKNLPLKLNGTELVAQIELPISNNIKTRRNILPFMKYIYDSMALYRGKDKNQKKSLNKVVKLLYCITSVFICIYLMSHFMVYI